jgi:hypothetical protein
MIEAIFAEYIWDKGLLAHPKDVHGSDTPKPSISRGAAKSPLSALSAGAARHETER